jgi:G:T-mismatch repair DNA endonuclease (very short patch repair protein)
MRSKEKYDSIPLNHIVHCDVCGRNLEKRFIRIRNLKENGNNGTCAYCDWLKRHKNIVPNIDGWTKEDVKTALSFLLTTDDPYLNTLQSMYKNRSLKDICKMVQQLGNHSRKILVKTNCEYCGQEIEDFPSVYLVNKHSYCSNECYHKDKPNKLDHGKESQFYNRINTFCTNCGKPLAIIPSNYNKVNSFGENFNYCSRQCYYEFKSKHYIQEKSPMFNKKFTPEQKEKIRLRIAQNSARSNKRNSKIQLKINSILDELKINYEREKIFEYYAADNYLNDFNLIIEVMGDYWHGNPIRYNENKYTLNSIQDRTIIKDKQKKSYITNKYDIKILYLWETDINKNEELCKKLIQEYINCNGVLNNYHSFNYSISESSLSLNSNIITPYQDLNRKEYTNIIK